MKIKNCLTLAQEFQYPRASPPHPGFLQFLIKGETILDFHMCFLEILEILDFGGSEASSKFISKGMEDQSGTHPAARTIQATNL